MDVVSRSKAKTEGKKTYFTGLVCKHGHVAPRRTENGQCVQCANLRRQKYYHDHREYEVERSIKRTKTVAQTPEHKAARKRIWEKHRDKYTKQKRKHYKEHATSINEKRRALHQENPWVRMYQEAKSRAKKKNIPFDLSFDELLSIVPADMRCPILGIEMKPANGKPTDFSPTLDKVIPAKGYVKTNIAIISRRANTLKSNETNPKTFRAIADWLERQQENASGSTISSNAQPRRP